MRVAQEAGRSCEELGMTKSAWAMAIATAGLGCMVPGTMEDFKSADSGGIKRAAYELGCPEPQLQLMDLGGGTIGVSGCGKKAVYKWATTGWVNNTAVDTNGEAPKK